MLSKLRCETLLKILLWCLMLSFLGVFFKSDTSEYRLWAGGSLWTADGAGHYITSQLVWGPCGAAWTYCPGAWTHDMRGDAHEADITLTHQQGRGDKAKKTLILRKKNAHRNEKTDTEMHVGSHNNVVLQASFYLFRPCWSLSSGNSRAEHHCIFRRRPRIQSSPL